MTIRRFALLSLLAFSSSVFVGCDAHRTASLDEALNLYRENKLEEALPLFEQLAVTADGNPEHHAWLAETYRRLGRKKEAIESARRALTLNPRHSFAHLVIAEASNPVTGDWAQANADTTWNHLLKAIESDSSDGNPWLLMWGEAIQRGDVQTVRKAQRKFVETGLLTKAALSYGRWMLRALPHDAILLTNGDMDTYPPLAVQETENFRRDVAVVNRGMLNTIWYARFIRMNCGVPLPIDDVHMEQLRSYKDDQGNLVTPSDQIFREWVNQAASGSVNRPITVAVTVEASYWSGVKDNMQYAGSFLQWRDATTARTPDSMSIRRSLEGMSPDDFAGPWVSDQDRSPVRRVHTKRIVNNVTEAAVNYSDYLLKGKRLSEADLWLKWAEELEKVSEMGPSFTDRISVLREELSKAMR